MFAGALLMTTGLRCGGGGGARGRGAGYAKVSTEEAVE
jgi:hypothetical protein